ncbi:hypothetical protein J3366_21330 [Tritonibacter mobilis]|uniref:hypothetical protein n=1 Tax=Tritonibacter mobilis TaxID=379347 RepID=UPI003BA92D26
MKEVILHIGFHKTGSTSIQSALKGYDKSGVKYASFHEENHSIPIYTIFSENRYNYHIWQREGLSKSDIDFKKNEYLEILHNELGNGTASKLIISGEDMSVLQPSEVDYLASTIKSYGVNVKVICYVRHPLSWVASNTQERVKAGMKIVNTGSIFRAAIENYINSFGDDSVFVFDFERETNKHNSVVRHFSKILSLNIKEPKRANEGMTAVEFALLSELNEASRSLPIMKSREVIISEIRSTVSEMILNENLQRREIEKNFFLGLLGESIPEECVWLSERFGIKYEIPHRETDICIREYIRNTLNDSFGAIANLFHNMGLLYDLNMSLQDNFLRAYIALEANYIDFSAVGYLKKNPDVRAAGVNPYRHYLEFGISEGRCTK